MEPQAYTELQQLEPTHWWYRGMRSIVAALLASAGVHLAESLALDAGCGAGGNLTHLARYGRAVGCDLSPHALTYAAEQHAGRLVQATVEALPYRAGSFALVTSFDVLYAREVDDDERALAEFARVLAPNGYVLVRLPALKVLAGQHDLVVHGARRYTRAEVEAKLRRAGLTPLRSTYVNSLLFPVVYMVRRWQRNRTAAAPSDVRPTPRPLNALLAAILRLEAAWIGVGGSFPIGVSVMALAQKVEV